MEEVARLRPGQTLFTYLHLAADKRLTEFLAERRVDAIAYETVRTADGSLSAHYENSILITKGDPEILTRVGDETV